MCSAYRVQRVRMLSGTESSTVLRDGVVVDPADRFLAHLSAIDRSPNTVRAYAHDLRDFFEFLDRRGLRWDGVVLEDLGRFVAWLRLPPQARSGNVAQLPWVEPSLVTASVNRKLSALASFYEFHQRHGVGPGDLLTQWRPGRRGGSWQPFLAHLGQRPERHRVISLRTERRCPCRKPHPHWSSGIFVLVQDAAESVASSYVEVDDLAGIGEWFGERVQWSAVGDALMRPMLVVEVFELS